MVCSVARFDFSFGTGFLMYIHVQIALGSVKEAE